MEIREIQQGDIPSILELVGNTLADRPAYREEYEKLMADRISYYLKNRGKSAQYVALLEGRIIGFVLAGVVSEEDIAKYYFVDHENPEEILSWVLLAQITVEAGHRREKVGSSLMEAVEQRARELNLKGVYTGTRGEIRFFYEKNGFQIDKVFLKKELSGPLE